MPKSARDRIMFPYNFSEFRQAGQSSDLMFSAKEELAGTLRDFGDLVEAIESHPEDFKNISWTTMAKRPVRIPNHVALAKFIVEQCNLMTKAFDEVAKQMEKAPDIVDADFATRSYEPSLDVERTSLTERFSRSIDGIYGGVPHQR